MSAIFGQGQLSAQRAVLEVRRLRSRHSKAVEAFVEEAVVRRELADNFCFYQPHYDSVQGAYGWAAETLKVHSRL
ncbi:Deoxyribodipyrimidine photo-lyase [Amphibalanus amphitrite]|uniref:Deoxyribodipyrimidine photo-lyase n=1 Tax=Amphibalanus amphitrite TaxID=1232801 RepID=A0A6A4WG70_AMPAM|nr:Deoxyribodipyrimidine photo-lyase [Amphibalanus amphitrite]